MNLLSANCRGCGSPEAVQELHSIVDTTGPTVVFLMETKLGKKKAQRLKGVLGFSNSLAVGSEGRSDGLALYWRREVKVKVESVSKSHIDVILSSEATGDKQWRFTGFYGEPKRVNRKDSWYLMRFLRSQLDLPWLCTGDFNEVLSADEHIWRQYS